LDVSLRAHFQKVINLSKSGEKLTIEITEQMENTMRSHPGPNQVYVILIGGNNMRKTTKPALEVTKLVSRFRRIMTEAQKAKVRVLLCGTIPDPRPAIDSKLKLLDEALNDLEMGEGNRFLTLRGSMLDAQGKVWKDIYKPRGDIHLNASGTKIASLRIQRMLEIMLQNLVQAPVQAPVPTPTAQVQATAVTKTQRVRVQAPAHDPAPVVNVQQVAAVVNAPAVVSQEQVETPMEVEDEEALLQRLFFKRFGRALLEQEKEKEKDDVDNINMDLIDLTKDDKMEEDSTPVLVPLPIVVKTEPTEVAESPETIANVAELRKERRELVKARKAVTAFGKSLRKSNVIPEKVAPTPENVIADSNVSEDASVNNVESVIPVDAEIEADKRAFVAEFGDVPLDEFDNIGSGFRLYGPEDVLPSDDEEAMMDDI
jgi:hypothetical protein